MFEVPLVPVVEETVNVYSHGIPPEQVEEIKKQKELLEKRITNGGEPVTLEEFKTIVIPFLRIQRTEVFLLTPIKEKKVRVPREPKAPKPKRLTKKAIQERLDAIIFKKFTTTDGLNEEEEAFLNEHTSEKII